jgi:hypothetical protein
MCRSHARSSGVAYHVHEAGRGPASRPRGGAGERTDAPQKEETKPLEPEAEVAILIPEPPKPEPPTEKKHATALPRAKTPPPSSVKRFNRFPSTTPAHGDQGTLLALCA